MGENIRSYKDLHKAIKKLRTQTSSYEDSLCANPFSALLKDKEVKGDVDVPGLFEWKARPATQFVTRQFITPTLLLRSFKFFYRAVKKHPKRLFGVGLILVFAFAGVQLKKWWSK